MKTAPQLWDELTSARSSMMNRLERFASMTLPKLLLPAGVTVENSGFSNENQSLGAQAVNHLANRLCLTMFAPSRPAFRLVPTKALTDQLEAQGIDPVDIEEILAGIERKCARELDAKGQRAKLHLVAKHVIVLGQALLYTPKDYLRVLGLRYWCVKRYHDGKIAKLIVREDIRADELDPDVRQYTNRADEQKVSYYRVMHRTVKGKWTEDAWLDNIQLPAEFTSTYTDSTTPWHVPVWDLGDDADYATGLVEEFSADLERYSALSEATSDGTIVALDFKFFVDQGAGSTPEEYVRAKRGDFLYGRKDDVGLSNAVPPQVLQVADASLQRYERRIAQAFMLASATVRSAERVTAEEIRMIAQELESSFGGVYSALADTFQSAIARWLLRQVELPVDAKYLDVAVITGLDALSRTGDLDAMTRGLEILGKAQTLPEGMLRRLNFDELARRVGQGVGYDFSKVLLSDEQIQQAEQQQAAGRVAEAGATAQAEGIQ